MATFGNFWQILATFGNFSNFCQLYYGFEVVVVAEQDKTSYNNSVPLSSSLSLVLVLDSCRRRPDSHDSVRDFAVDNLIIGK